MMNRDPRPQPRPPLLGRLLPSRARAHAVVLAVGLATIAPMALVDRGLGRPRDDDRPHRDVTVFGLRAEPGRDWIDPKLMPYARPLRNLLPDHGLTYLGADSHRLSSNESLGCDLGDGRTLRVTLIDPLGPGGKVHLRVTLLEGEGTPPVFITDLHAPSGQLVFLDKVLAGGDARLLVGVGAR